MSDISPFAVKVNLKVSNYSLYTHVVKRVRAKFSKNCAFCDRTIIFIVRFDFGMRTDII